MKDGALRRWTSLRICKKINAVGKNSAERPGKPGNSKELGSFCQIRHFYILYTYNLIDDRRG